MIRLTRISKEPFILNADLIRYIEARPDTFITLLSGERVVVLESMEEVVSRAIAYQQQKHLIPIPQAAAATHSTSRSLA
jgi:flagellar protein FlbD